MNYAVAPALPAGATSGTLEVLKPPVVGSVILGQGDHANYNTCSSCLLVSAGLKRYFADSGILKVTALGASNIRFAGELKNVKLVEVTIDGSTFKSTPVPGGECLTISSATFDTR